MVYNSLLAFSAADASINIDWSSGNHDGYSIQSRIYFDKAVKELRQRIKDVDERRARGKSPQIVPILYTVFLLAGYGVSPSPLRQYHSYSD